MIQEMRVETATTTQRNRILRAFPQFTVAKNNGLTYATLPLGEIRA